MSEVTVVTEAVRSEAQKWRRLADQVQPIKTAVDDAGLDVSAFFIGDANAAMHAAVYRQYKEFISSVLAGGVTEFEQIGGALDRIADAYDNADQIVSLDFNKIYTA
jgi:uncharacterized protein YukE